MIRTIPGTLIPAIVRMAGWAMVGVVHTAEYASMKEREEPRQCSLVCFLFGDSGEYGHSSEYRSDIRT